MKIYFLLFALAWFGNCSLGLAATVDDAAKKEGQLVLYGTTAVDHQAKITEGFTRKYPFIKFENFRGNSERVLNRVLTEGRTGTYLVDVINIDGPNGLLLKDRGYLQPYKSKETESFPEQFRDPEGFLPCCLQVTTSVIGYNTRLVPKNEAPRSFHELLDAKWKGKIGIDGDSSEWFAALMHIWGKEKTVDFFRALVKQEPSKHRGRTLLAQMLAAGEFPIVAELFGYRVLEFQERGAPVEIVNADPVIARPWHLLLASKAPHPNTAKLYIDYLLSVEGQQVMAGLGRVVVRPGVKQKFPRLTEGVKLYPAKPEPAKSYEEITKLYYSIVK
jgi:iron(III) transport system substrate-binding protein